ncbi:MAG: zinc ribbon domain-containing protein YjdM [Flavobacterium sp.]
MQIYYFKSIKINSLSLEFCSKLYFWRLKFITMDVKDSNGNILQDGDSVTVIKDLKVRGSSDVIKRGTMVKNIRLTDDPAEIDCRVNKTAMVLRTEFVKKA